MIKRRAETITIQDAICQFVEMKQAEGLNKNSIKEYSVLLPRLVSDFTELKQITKTYMNEFISDMLKTKKPVTVNHYIRVYRAFLYWCMDEGYITPFKIKAVKEQEPPLRIYSIEDINKLLERPTRKDSFATWRTWCMVAFVMGTGARVGTLTNIRVEDIDLNAQEVVYQHTKNKKATVIPICNQLKTCITQYLREFDINDILFPLSNGSIADAKSVRQYFEKYCNDRGVEYKSFHALRHTYAKQFIVNGGNPFQLQKMLCHQSLDMSNHYAHLFATDLRNVVNDFSPISNIMTEEKDTRIYRR